MKKITLLFLCFLTGCHRSISVPDKKPETIISHKISIESSLLKLHNIERIKRNLPVLLIDKKLNEYAQNHSFKMATDRKLVHSKISVFLKDYNSCGENIAFGQKTPEEVTKSWMNSRPHKANILNKQYKFVGFGSYEIEGQVYWCAVFGS